MSARKTRTSPVPVLSAVVAVLASVVVTAPPASAATTVVNCGADPGALQPAIDAAASGDSLLVRGRCYGNFVIDKALAIRGAATLDGQGAAPTLTVLRDGLAELAHVKITNGKGGQWFRGPGGGIDVDGGVSFCEEAHRCSGTTEPGSLRLTAPSP